MSEKHGHDHAHGTMNYNKAFGIGIFLNSAFVIVEAIYGVMSHSLSLIADAGHNLSDVLALVLAWVASILVNKKPTAQRTYGFKRSSILAALFNALFLLIAIGAIAWEAIRRFNNPQPVVEGTVIWVAAVGIVINAITALLFMRGSKGDINVKGAFLHMAADAGVSLGVVIAGVIILMTNWVWLDPVVSLLIVIVVFISTWTLLKDSVNMALDAVPNGINISEVKTYFEGLSSVTNVHDLHIWGMSTTENALTVHLVVQEPMDHEELIRQSTQDLHEKFSIDHATIQIEKNNYDCKLAPDHIV
ncbi:cobalt-zinc-cadmium efflux system protein [Paenibacillus shirakamiensis]|uniref:Cobalt-zinc-cadmium efflux system protein n=1 Tax=Paenibacillus shirakamiensis TaxID=1265935 RepID=A0ABS4JHW4_9BACL|nr:cation diffusion facilitator family transporter [Paenibacillus shirakamiensis]MBP2000129.1 cobalt-zinc-cadmium efflux system protein [Paenibacillus shirakamiensis]